MAKIFEFNQVNAEGYTGEVKEVFQDPVKDLYAARQNQSIILQGLVTGADTVNVGTKGKSLCAILSYGSARGLIPLEESGCNNEDQLERLIGQMVAFVVIGIDPESNIFAASRKQALDRMAARTWKDLKAEQVRTVVVRSVNMRKAKVDIGGIVVDLPAEDISYGWVNDVRELLSVGDNIDVKVLAVDKENNNVRVSLKALHPDPWPMVSKRYRRGMKTMGVVSGVENYGIFIQLEPGVDMLSKQKTAEYRPAIGERVLVEIDHIDNEKRQVRGRVRRKL